MSMNSTYRDIEAWVQKDRLSAVWLSPQRFAMLPENVRHEIMGDRLHNRGGRHFAGARVSIIQVIDPPKI